MFGEINEDVEHKKERKIKCDDCKFFPLSLDQQEKMDEANDLQYSQSDEKMGKISNESLSDY